MPRMPWDAQCRGGVRRGGGEGMVLDCTSDESVM